MIILHNNPRRTTLQGQIRHEETTKSRTCMRCGIRHVVRVVVPDWICWDCRSGDPMYVTMIEAKQKESV